MTVTYGLVRPSLGVVRLLHARLDLPMQSGESTATLLILFGTRCVDRVTVPLPGAGSNVRIKAHNTVDPDLHRFREQLLPAKLEESREFEAAVGLLFFFLGFHVDPLSALKGLGDAVDHLAHARASSVILVIECTVGPIDLGGKVGKLINRSQRTRRELTDSEVIAVLATASGWKGQYRGGEGIPAGPYEGEGPAGQGGSGVIRPPRRSPSGSLTPIRSLPHDATDATQTSRRHSLSGYPIAIS